MRDKIKKAINQHFEIEFRGLRIGLFLFGIIAYVGCIALAIIYNCNSNFETATVCLLSGILFMQICLSNIKLNTPVLLWASAAFQGIPAAASILFAIFK